MNDITYCINSECALKDGCKRSAEFEPGSFKPYAAFYFNDVDGIVTCNYFIEKTIDNTNNI